MNGALLHVVILAWGIRRKNFTTEITEWAKFGVEGACPFVQFRRRNSALEAAIFSWTRTYYLVQEKP